MDLGTIIGIVAGAAIISAAILMGSGAGAFVNVPSLLIVLGGTLCVTFIKFPLNQVMGFFKLGLGTAFKNQKSEPEYLVEKAVEAAQAVRKNGLVALERVEVSNDLFQRGLRLCADGHPIDVIKTTIGRDIARQVRQMETAELMFRGIGESAPAFGMLGTLVGLIQMLSNMNDPAAIGPAMAVAMLTTFYGAFMANLMAIPIADKLAHKAEQDGISLDLILDALTQIHANQSPTVVQEVLSPYLQETGVLSGKAKGKGKGKARKAAA